MKYLFFQIMYLLPLFSNCQNTQFETGTSLCMGKGAFRTRGSVSAGLSIGISRKISNKTTLLFNSEIIYFQNEKGTLDDSWFIPIKVGINKAISKKDIYLFIDGGAGAMIFTQKSYFPYTFSFGLGWKKKLKYDYINCKVYFNYVNARSIPEYRWLTIQVAWGLNRKK